jgi:uncharacterized protein YjiS (DUF1127 family)
MESEQAKYARKLRKAIEAECDRRIVARLRRDRQVRRALQELLAPREIKDGGEVQRQG